MLKSLAPPLRKLGVKSLRVKSPCLPPRLYRPSSTFTITYPCNRPVFVFLAGCPGAGKTHALHKIYDLANVEILDLDVVMKEHPDYNRRDAARVYSKKKAYNWADSQIERCFQDILEQNRVGSLERPIHVLDGTSANYERSIRRMTEAKDAGFWTVLLYCRVSVDTALRRNAARNRRVPEDELRGYVPSVDRAVQMILEAENCVHECIVLDNDEDDSLTEAERWGRFQKRIQEDSTMRTDFMDW